MKEHFDIPARVVEHIGDLFQQLTKYHSKRGAGALPEGGGGTGAPETALPPPLVTGGPRIWDAMRSRRSIRSYADSPLRREELSQLLWACQGVTASEHGYLLRTAPSAGALYPVETYVIVHAVSGMRRGVYRYEAAGHGLRLLREGEFGRHLAEAALGQGMAGAAGAVFAWTAVVQRSRRKYRQRCYRYIYLDAGHIGQNLSLAAEALGLGCCCIGALFDDDVNGILGADGREETVVYMACVGRKTQ